MIICLVNAIASLAQIELVECSVCFFAVAAAAVVVHAIILVSVAAALLVIVIVAHFIADSFSHHSHEPFYLIYRLTRWANWD